VRDDAPVQLLRLLLVVLLVAVPAAVRAAPADCPAMAVEQAAPSCHESAPDDAAPAKKATAGCCEAYCATAAVLPAAPAAVLMQFRDVRHMRATETAVSLTARPTDPPPRLS
jgi:hypothetical protein